MKKEKKPKNFLTKYREELNKGLWNRMLKFYKGNIQKTLNSLIKDERRMLRNSEKLANRKIKFFKKLAKEEQQKGGKRASSHN